MNEIVFPNSLLYIPATFFKNNTQNIRSLTIPKNISYTDLKLLFQSIEPSFEYLFYREYLSNEEVLTEIIEEIKLSQKIYKLCIDNNAKVPDDIIDIPKSLLNSTFTVSSSKNII